MIGSNFSNRPSSLSLRGPDYSIEVDRSGFRHDMTIEKRGNRIQVDRDGSDDTDIRVDSDRIEIDRQGIDDDVSIRQRGNRISIDRSGINNDLEITMRGSTIEIDRAGIDNDVSYRFEGDRLEIDRNGIDRDLSVRRRGQTVEFDLSGIDRDVSVDSSVELDPVLWEEQLGMPAEGWSILRGWFDGGALNMDDLVQLSQDGNVRLRDHLFT